MSGIWWGGFEFEEGETRLWRLGPLSVWITRASAEFRIATKSEPDGDESPLLAGVACDGVVPENADLVRYGVGRQEGRLEITPAVADRPVVVKSETSYVVAPGGSVTAFVSSPVWVNIQLSDPLRPLREEPTWRPSDTWFGPSTMVGQLCYAVRTSVRYVLENVPARPYRAVSVVRIYNLADTPLPLARLRLPMPFLSLFADRNGRLWTEAVTLERRADDDLAEVKLGEAAPREAGPCALVAGPREKMERRSLLPSFTGLLGLHKDKVEYERVVE